MNDATQILLMIGAGIFCLIAVMKLVSTIRERVGKNKEKGKEENKEE